MPAFLSAEVEQAAIVTAAIDACVAPRRRPLASRLELSAVEAIPLLNGLAGATRAVLVRQLLLALGFDEYRHLRWRLEHKLVQALVLHAYCPGFVPVACGLNAFLNGKGGAGARSRLSVHFPDGYLIKAALGDSSGGTPAAEATEGIVGKLEEGAQPAAPGKLLDETYVIQERVLIEREYRVHSLEEQVIEDLTFLRYIPGSIPGGRDAPNTFVTGLLRKLPDGIVNGSLLAWDIALSPGGDFSVIEANFSGIHPVFKPGFHCSGYYHDRSWGACDTARLLNHVARTDGVEVIAVPDAPEHPVENSFYADAAAWQARHKAAKDGVWSAGKAI